MSMTENEVLKDLQNYQGILKAKTRINASVNPEIALNAITEAIEVIQQYRAIGTVEEIYDMLKVLNRTVSEIHSEVSKYQSIGTIEDFKGLKEKNEPKKPILNNPKINEFYIKEAKLCPVCHSYINNYSGDYCRDCGQRIDWNENEDSECNMNEFIEKLIGRLEENGQKMCEAKSSVPYGKNSPSNHRYYKAISVKKAIHIVNQLAEGYKQHNDHDLMIVESLPSLYPLQPFEEEAIHKVVSSAKDNNDFCEWEEDMTLSKTAIAHGKFESMMYVCKWKYCPYCGKKIKISPYQPEGE